MKLLLNSTLLAVAAAASLLLAPAPAAACGGFFCSQAQPVNQAAERIVFADNGDGTVTAVIQIMYEGPSESFSWLLPISSVPGDGDIGVASDLAFQRLQSATNPQYTLTTRTEGTCRTSVPAVSSGGSGGTASFGGGSGGGAGASSDGGVTVEASGVVGAFEWTVISFDPGLADPAEAAVTWLEANAYDVPSGAPALMSPYLEDGLNLLALRLTKGSDVGSIRPIVLTYDATLPMIPVKLTAVAANDDMGVMTWVLGSARAVPQNYYALELNEARINWFNAASNYNSVVIAAADDAGGQGFVTEYAAQTSALANVVWSTFDEQQWQSFQASLFSSFEEMFNISYSAWGTWDGYWDAVKVAVTLPDTVLFEDFKLCPSCYSADVQLAPSAFIAALDEHVIAPVRSVQELIDRSAMVTRLYTTLSAMEMTLDPLFTFNPDLAAVSNLHTAERIIECHPAIYASEARWRIELPQGGVVRGTPADAATQAWPDALDSQPANLRILRAAESGEGRVVEDNTETINTMLDDYNEGVPSPSGVGGASTGGSLGTGGSGTGGTVGGVGGTGGTEPGDGGCSCSVAGAGSSRGALAWAALGVGLALLGRRRTGRRRST